MVLLNEPVFSAANSMHSKARAAYGKLKGGWLKRNAAETTLKGTHSCDMVFRLTRYNKGKGAPNQWVQNS